MIPTDRTMDGIEDEAQDLLEESPMPYLTTGTKSQLLAPFLITSVTLNIFFVFLIMFLMTHKIQPHLGISYEEGFSTDLDPSRYAIKLDVKSFGGGVKLDGGGKFYLDGEGKEYIGLPSAEVDEAWEDLLGGLNLDFDRYEADLKNSTFRWPDSGRYFSGLDVFHSLHCLNRLRQAIYPEYYTHSFDRLTGPSRSDHIGHCINHIRQALQCHGDLTPMEWKLEGSQIILKTDTPHTCRDFEKIREWAISHRTKFEEIRGFLDGSLQIID